MALSNTVQLRDGMSNVLSRIASNLSTVNDRTGGADRSVFTI